MATRVRSARTEIGIDPHAPFLMRCVDAERSFRNPHRGILIGDGGEFADFGETKTDSGVIVMSIRGPQGGYRQTVEMNSSECRHLMVGMNVAHRTAFRGEDAFILAADR